MAKYEDFTALNTQYGLSEEDYSKEDLALAKLLPAFGIKLAQLKHRWQIASTPQSRALLHGQAQQLRQSVGGYTGSEDGSGFEIGDMDAYVKASAYNRVTNPTDFTFDPGTSSLYKQYLKEAQRAGEDTLGKNAALTGGTPSSYAQTAAQQAYQNHIGDGLTDAYNQAYKEYLQDLENQQAALDAVNEKESAAREAADSDYEKALERAKLFGSVDADGADTLGLAEGTLTQSAKKTQQDEEIASLKAQITELQTKLKGGTAASSSGTVSGSGADVSTKAKALAAFVTGNHSDEVINALLAFGALNSAMKTVLNGEGLAVTENGKIIRTPVSSGTSAVPGTQWLGSSTVNRGGKTYVWVNNQGYVELSDLQKQVAREKLGG